jgi:hypothetical protein
LFSHRYDIFSQCVSNIFWRISFPSKRSYFLAFLG